MKGLLFLMLVLLVLPACERAKPEEDQVAGQAAPAVEAPAAETPVGETKQAPGLNVANVLLKPAKGEPVLLSVEVAGTPDERRHGLMGRENLPGNHGMWFVFDGDVQDSFWMRDTALALDILFVDKDFKIVDIIADTEPNSEALLTPRQKYRYVLEVKAGTAAARGVAVGDMAEFRLGPP